MRITGGRERRMSSASTPVEKPAHSMHPFRFPSRQNPSLHLAVIGITLLALSLAGYISSRTSRQADLEGPHPTYLAMDGALPDEKYPRPATDVPTVDPRWCGRDASPQWHLHSGNRPFSLCPWVRDLAFANDTAIMLMS